MFAEKHFRLFIYLQNSIRKRAKNDVEMLEAVLEKEINLIIKSFRIRYTKIHPKKI